MIYAVEWFELPRTDYSHLIMYHPELTKGDLKKLDGLDQEHYLSGGITFLLSSLIANRVLLRQQKPSIHRFMQKRWLRTPVACFFGGLFTVAVNKTIMIPVYEKDLQDLGLSKYYELDLDASMMREDLRKMNIRRISEHEAMLEQQIKEAK